MKMKRRFQKGFTLVEMITTLSIFTVVMGLSFSFFTRVQSTVQLSESESKMQMYSRLAMTNIAKELRQASDYYELPFAGVPQAKEILIVRPTDDKSIGAMNGYILVRYWFEENSQGVYSLYRAQRDHNNEPHFLTADSNFKPSTQSASDRSNFLISAMIKEATVIEPGKQSYFMQDSQNSEIITIRLVTATYGYKHAQDLTGKKLEVKRQFRIDTSINARNLQ